VAKDKIFPRILVNVVEPIVLEPVTCKFANVAVETDKYVEVELVIVPLVAVTLVKLIVPAERLVTVALVRVASVPTKFVVLVVAKLDVEALVVLE
jgi:hypothetical protein